MLISLIKFPPLGFLLAKPKIKPPKKSPKRTPKKSRRRRLNKVSRQEKNRRTWQKVAMAAAPAIGGRHHQDSRSRPRKPAIATSYQCRVVMVGGGGDESHHLFLCDLPAFLVLPSHLFLVITQLNLLPTTTNKTNKNSKDYIII